MQNRIHHQLAKCLRLKQLYLEQLCGIEFIDTPHIVAQPSHSHIALDEQIRHCHLCALAKTKAQPNAGYLPPSPKIAFVSETPLLEHANVPILITRGGEMLQDMIEKILLLSLKEVAFLSLLKCMPPIGYQTTNDCYGTCAPYLFEQLQNLRPKIIVLLGALVTQYFVSADFESLRGKLGNWETMQFIPIYSPRFLLRNPSFKKETMRDLLLIKSLL